MVRARVRQPHVGALPRARLRRSRRRPAPVEPPGGAGAARRARGGLRGHGFDVQAPGAGLAAPRPTPSRRAGPSDGEGRSRGEALGALPRDAARSRGAPRRARGGDAARRGRAAPPGVRDLDADPRPASGRYGFLFDVDEDADAADYEGTIAPGARAARRQRRRHGRERCCRAARWRTSSRRRGTTRRRSRRSTCAPSRARRRTTSSALDAVRRRVAARARPERRPCPPPRGRRAARAGSPTRCAASRTARRPPRRGRAGARLRGRALGAAQLERVRPQPLTRGEIIGATQPRIAARCSVRRTSAALRLARRRAGSRRAHALAAAPARRPRPSACILLWLNGGPSHIDTFDPKPGRADGRAVQGHQDARAGHDARASTCRCLAERGDKLAVVRSMSSKEGNHQRAQYLVHTGLRAQPDRRAPVARRLASRAPRRPAGRAAAVREHRRAELRRGLPRRAERALRRCRRPARRPPT